VAADPERYRRLKELFHDLVDRLAEEREERLASLSGEDPAAAAELRSLLDAHAAAGDFVSKGLAAHQAALQDEVGSSLVGRRLGPYRLERMLGRGGMGVVYLAVRADDQFRQRVAVKLLRPELASPDLVRRFRTERQALANLRHPNVAALLDGGETDDGLPYFVMEFVEGVPLEEHCDAARLSVEARLSLFRTVCGAVEEAHRNLIVHRDIKPANILVDGQGAVKLLDFGIAKLLAEGEDGTVAPTRALGYATPAFASPEQLAGRPITTATDVYALGVLLHRLLTGCHPYDLSGVTGPEVAQVVEEVAPDAPSAAAAKAATTPAGTPEPARLSRVLSGDLDQIVLKALRKEPERRYASVADLSEDVARYLDGRPVAARPDTLAYRTGRFVRRHRAAVALTALVVLGLVGGLLAYARQARVARAQASRAETERARAEQVVKVLGTLFSSADPALGAGRRVTVAEVLDDASSRLGKELSGQPEIERSLRSTLGETYLNLGLLAEAEREFARALALAPPEAVAERLQLARALADGGKFAEAEREVERILADCKAMPTPEVACARVPSLKVQILQNLGRAKEAIEVGTQAIPLLERSFPEERTELAALLNNVAICYGNTGDPARAEALQRRALEIALAEKGERYPLSVDLVANLAGALDIQGKLDEALPLYRKAVALQEAVRGERHFAFLRTLTSTANLLWLMKRPAEAEPLARRAQALGRDALGPDHPMTAYAELVLGQVLLDLGQPAEAEGHIRAALESRRKKLPPGHWLLANTRSTLGAALLGQRRYREAETELTEAYEALLKDRGPSHEKTLVAASRLSQLYASTGRPDEAKRFQALAVPPPAPAR
jgi:eukaryotic-like serine/threonine-protein kinase